MSYKIGFMTAGLLGLVFSVYGSFTDLPKVMFVVISFLSGMVMSIGVYGTFEN